MFCGQNAGFLILKGDGTGQDSFDQNKKSSVPWNRHSPVSRKPIVLAFHVLYCYSLNRNVISLSAEQIFISVAWAARPLLSLQNNVWYVTRYKN